ncbi:MAG: hypothetical protein ABIM74_10025 [candidate division WOR-3 bacterium]
MNTRRIFPAVILGAALLACQMFGKKEAKDSFTGRWDTNWGTVELTQKGNVVDGTYEYKGTKGMLTGEIVNDTFYFTWTEISAGQKAEGVGYFVLRDKGYRIEGKWGQANERGDWNIGEWKGKRVE